MRVTHVSSLSASLTTAMAQSMKYNFIKNKILFKIEVQRKFVRLTKNLSKKKNLWKIFLGFWSGFFLLNLPQCLQKMLVFFMEKPVWPKPYHLRSLCRRCSRLPRLPRRRWQCPEGRRKTDSGPEKGQILSSTGDRQLSDQDKVLILMPINTISMEFLEYLCEAIYFTGNINST